MKSFHIQYLLIVWLGSLGLAPASFSQDVRFKHVALEDGQLQGAVNCTLQDKDGFLWVGTKDGLNRFDGYSFKTFFNNPQDSTSISNNWVWTIYEDENRNLWIGTEGGLDLFQKKTETFQHIKSNNKSNPITRVRSLKQDSIGNLWLGQLDHGLSMYNIKTRTIQNFKQEVKNERSAFLFNQIHTLCLDKNGNLWVGSKVGLHYFNVKTKEFELFINDPKNSKSLTDNTILSLLIDKHNQLWVGTKYGLNLFNTKTKTFKHFLVDASNPNSLSNNVINTIFEDSKGNLWIGTENGINLFNPNKRIFKKFFHNSVDSGSISDNLITSFTDDAEGNLIIGTNTGGIDILNNSKKKFKTYSHDPSNPESLTNNIVWTFCEDSTIGTWIGTDNGLDFLDTKTQKFLHFKNIKGDPHSLSANLVSTVFMDSYHNLFVGTKRDGGLNLFNRQTKKFQRFQHNSANPKSLPDNYVRCLFEGSNKKLWVITMSGISGFDKNSNTFENYVFYPNESLLNKGLVGNAIQDHQGEFWGGLWKGFYRANFEARKIEVFRHNPSDALTISNDYALCVLEDHLTRIWVGTNDKGLNLFDRKTKTFSVILKEDGLPDNCIYAILEDDHGRLWISTNKGISCYTPSPNPRKGNWGKFRNYTIDDGLQNNEFNERAALKGKNGVMYFGGINGFNVFHPDSIEDNQYPPPIAITNLEIFNKEVRPQVNYNGFTLPSSITYSDTLKLSYRESVFTLKFSGLSFTQPEKNTYAYRLEGFDKDWNYTEAKRRYATYTNLDPGTYTFRVKVSNQDGIWNETGRKLIILISPPWWKTWWFRSTLLLFIISSIVMFIRIRIRQIKKINKILTETVAQKTKKLTEANLILLKQEKEISEQNKELIEQAAQLEKYNKQLEKSKGLLEIEIKYLHQTQLFKSSIDVQEEERKRIAQNLHDELGATLSIARMHLDQMLQPDTKMNINESLERTKILTETALASMRRISHELMPPLLEKYGLIEAILGISAQLSTSQKISLNLFSTDQQYRWPLPIELGLYRICMELINNTIKYAEATKIEIHIEQNKQTLTVNYSDNGRGLPKVYHDGLGFRNITARINSLGGSFEIRTNVVGGFFVELSIPHTTN